MCRLSNRPSKSPLIINAFNISLIWYALHSAVYLMHFPTNAGDSVVLVNVPWPISAHEMSLGQIKLRNWPSHCCGHHARFCIFMYTLVSKVYLAWSSDEIGCVARAVWYMHVVVYRRREKTATNDDSEQVSTVKRRSASGDGVDALNTRATNTNLGDASRGSLEWRLFKRYQKSRSCVLKEKRLKKHFRSTGRSSPS